MKFLLMEVRCVGLHGVWKKELLCHDSRLSQRGFRGCMHLLHPKCIEVSKGFCRGESCEFKVQAVIHAFLHSMTASTRASMLDIIRKTMGSKFYWLQVSQPDRNTVTHLVALSFTRAVKIFRQPLSCRTKRISAT